MVFEIHSLSSPLDKFIESIFYYKDYMPGHSIERVVPTGHIFILFELDGLLRNTYDNTSLEPNGEFSKVWVSGVHSNYLSISALPNSEMLAIQIKPFGGFPFFQFPINELNNRVVPAKEIWGENILSLRQHILDQDPVSKKFDAVEKWLLGKMNMNLEPNAEFMTTSQRILQDPLSEHQQIVNSFPKTQKHFIDQFKKYGGLTPKLMHRIMRFNDILQQIQHKKTISWTQIAYLSGFSDQSHFIKEFKEFSGFNPAEFIKLDHHQGPGNFFPLDGAG